jgi:membrane protein YqaA with SNARE-associated domain
MFRPAPLKATVLAIYAIALKLGGIGLLIVGLLDSSFLFMPFGNDLLILGLTANHHDKLLYYAVMATLGSGAGCFLTDWVARKGGEEGLQKLFSPKSFEYAKKRVSTKAGWALALASIMPPPFPFTLIVAGAAAFQYPRKKLLTIVVAMRFVRFLGIGLLAVFFGRGILQIAESRWVQYPILGLVILSIVGSAISLHNRIKRHGSTSKGPAEAATPA